MTLSIAKSKDLASHRDVNLGMTLPISAPKYPHPTEVVLAVLLLTSLQEHECKLTGYLIDVDSNGDEDHENAKCALQPHGGGCSLQ